MNRGDAVSRVGARVTGLISTGWVAAANSRLAMPVVAGVAGLTALFVLQATVVRGHVEDDLTGRTTIALNAVDLPQARVDVSGRDVVLRGLAADDGPRARAAVLTVRGVRAVTVVAPAVGAPAVPVPVPEPSPPPAPAPTEAPAPGVAGEPAPAGQPRDQLPFSLTFAGGGVRLTGWVGSDEQRQAVLAAVGSAGRPVDDQLMLDPSLAEADSPQVGELAAVVRAVPAPGGGLIVRYTDGKAVVRGSVRTAAAESAVLRAVARTAAPGVTEDHIDVP
ncbi:BON domain-containing protein [Spongisporangium articulatum]|uniref:BON domain-containing protein n=1 Tax=Spongisporangium articulatum TaxID=3362603 RepID=A0ABW8ATM3_9ACTN